MTQTASLEIALTGTLTGDAVGSSAPRYEFAERVRHSTPDGTDTGEADLAYVAVRTLAAETAESLDLAGSLETPVGDAAVFAEVTGLFITAAAGNGGTLTIGGAASNAFVGPFGDASDTIVLQPGQSFAVTNTGAGWAVAAGTGDLLKIENDDDDAASYTIRILGRSA